MPKKDRAVDYGRVQGWVEIIVRDKDGKIKFKGGSAPTKLEPCEGGNCPVHSSYPTSLIHLEYWRRNIITNVGLACVIRLAFYGLTEDKFRYLAIGTGLTGEAVGDTALEAEVKRKEATITQETTTVTDDTAKLEATFSSADGLSGTDNISEVGILNLPTAGDLLARKVFSAVPIDWDIGDTLTMRYFVQMAR